MRRQDIIKVFRYVAEHPNSKRDDIVTKTKVSFETVQYLLGNENRGEKYFRQYSDERGTVFVLTVEGHLFLLNYDSLEQSRKEFKHAMVVADNNSKQTRLAIRIAIATMFVAILVGVAQIVFT